MTADLRSPDREELPRMKLNAERLREQIMADPDTDTEAGRSHPEIEGWSPASEFREALDAYGDAQFELGDWTLASKRTYSEVVEMSNCARDRVMRATRGLESENERLKETALTQRQAEHILRIKQARAHWFQPTCLCDECTDTYGVLRRISSSRQLRDSQ